MNFLMSARERGTEMNGQKNKRCQKYYAYDDSLLKRIISAKRMMFVKRT